MIQQSRQYGFEGDPGGGFAELVWNWILSFF